ncbi:MAG: DUF4114 domain-containing protein [Bacteroidota bacterium]
MNAFKFTFAWGAILTLSLSAHAQYFSDMGSWNSNGVPEYLDPQNEPVDSRLLNDLGILLPDGENLLQRNPGLYYGNNTHYLTLQQAGDVYLTFISEGADFKSTVGFFTFMGTPPSATYQITNGKIVFPNLSFAGSGGGLARGNRVRLGHFPAGTSIGLFLISNAFQYERVMTMGNETYYTDPSFNPEPTNELKKHAVTLFDEATGNFVVLFEDFNRTGGSDHDFNDAIVMVSAQPRDAFITREVSKIQEEIAIKTGVSPTPVTTSAPAPTPGGTTPTTTGPQPVSEFDLCGSWELVGRNSVNNIEMTATGIRASAANSQNWFAYKKSTGNTYRDDAGRTYEFISENSGVWRSANGKTVIKLTRVSSCAKTVQEPKPQANRISICHYYPENPNPATITIPESAWPVHEAHGDTKGPCPEINTPAEIKRITVCHYPPGSPNNPVSIEIPESAWLVHEAHGDTRGECIIAEAQPEVTSGFNVCGDWELVGRNRINNIEMTATGIRAKAATNPSWFDYQKTAINMYRDNAGGTYEFESENSGVWKSVNGRTVIKLARVKPCEMPEKDVSETARISICHLAPGNSNPVAITIPESDWPIHEAHGDTRGDCDIVEVKPENVVAKIKICHYTAGRSTPREIEIPESAWPMHEAHGDIKGGCDIPDEGLDNNIRKITICHYPPGQPNNPQEIEIPLSAWVAHEAHGDTRGGCSTEKGKGRPGK